MTTTKYIFGQFSTYGGSYALKPEVHKHLAYLVYKVTKHCNKTSCTVYKLRNMTMEVGNYEHIVKTLPIACELHPRYAKITEFTEEISATEFPIIGDMHDKFDRIAAIYGNVTFYTDTYTDQYDKITVVHWIQFNGVNNKLFELILSNLEATD